MSTSNFYSQKDFPLIAAIYEKPDDIEAYEKETGDPYDETNDSYWYYEDMANDMNEAADDINEELKFYKVETRSGYYNGIQFYVNEDKVPDYEYTRNHYGEKGADEEAKFDYGDDFENAKAVEKAVEEEQEKVHDWLIETCKRLGLMCLGVSAHFSNGETLYHEIKLKDA